MGRVSGFREAASLVVLASLAAATVAAQASRLEYGVGTGLGVPVGDYHAAASGEGFNTSWQVLALASFRPPTLPVAIRVDLAYGTNSANRQLKDSLTTKIGRPADETSKLLGANLDVTYPLASLARARPYLLAGIGVCHQTFSVSTPDSTTDYVATKVAWNVGAGVSYGVGAVDLFLEGRFITVAALANFPRTTLLPITVGVRFAQR